MPGDRAYKMKLLEVREARMHSVMLERAVGCHVPLSCVHAEAKATHVGMLKTVVEKYAIRHYCHVHLARISEDDNS